MSDAWLTYHCRVREADVAMVEACLEEAGAAAVTCTAAIDNHLIVDELDGNQPLWAVCEVTGLFDLDADLTALEGHITTRSVASLEVRITTLQEENWHESWRDQFSERCYAGRLWICPTWCEPSAAAEVVVRIDPGMAFGTGNHATTAMCLDWLAHSDSIAGSKVLDYGCGSGILAFAAAKLGAKVVTAVDIDPTALAVCADNAALNGLNSIVLAKPDDLEGVEYDFIVANILLEPLIELIARFADLLAPGGRIVLSGILHEQVDELMVTYGRAFKMETRRQVDEWALVAGTRLPS
jgi:ribosomal protein L11 methyltransferase